MKLLLDTHTPLWCVDDMSRVSATAMAATQDPANERLLSAAAIWELAIKVGQGKILLAKPYRQWMETAIADFLRRMTTPTLQIEGKSHVLALK